IFIFFFSSRRRHTRFSRDWSSDVCSSDLSYFPFIKSNRKMAEKKELTPEEIKALQDENKKLSTDLKKAQDDLKKATDESAAKDRSEERRVGKKSKTRETRQYKKT